ncbi:glycosyltransferase [Vibrio sp. 10N.222.49.C12]|uniref:glycosyltransferase n=1 Tax=Vibrio sp. 10N.222.49.C12 TaxID=3229614 RepID=UPI00354FBD17
MTKTKVFHTIVNTFTAKRFIEPLCDSNSDTFQSTILIDTFGGDEIFLEQLSVSYKLFKFSINSNPLTYPLKLYKLINFFKKQNPDILVCHFTTGALIPLFAGFLCGVNTRVYYNHGVPYVGYKGLTRRAFAFLERMNCFFATDVLTVSKGMKPYLDNVSSKNAKVFGKGSICGLIDDWYRDPVTKDINVLRKRFSISTSDIVFIYVGRPFKRKGFLMVLQAFVESTLDNKILFLAGCTNDDVINYIGYIPDNVIALGLVDKIKSYYDLSDIVILPSFHEGFGYALLEGAASKCCLLASDIPGPDAILDDGYNGRFFTVGCVASLVSIINEVALDEHKLVEYKKNAYKSSLLFKRDLVVREFNRFLTSKK